MGSMGEQSRAFLLTGPGAAAIAVVRLTGPLTQTFLDVISPNPLRWADASMERWDEDRIIDDPVVVLLPEKRGADISLHGGAWVVKSALALARAWLCGGGIKIHSIAG